MTETPPGPLPLPEVPGLTDLSLFARGGYATVYRATQLSVGREVAVKVENRTLDSERDQQRFLREARAAGRMSSHPHVVDLFDVGVTADRHPYLIMELCDGSYAERMRTSPLGPREARDLGVKIADALAHSHASNVLHRDVKPANILYSGFNSAVLADFGLAVIGEHRDPSVMLEVLTPAYAPPEMFRHSPPAPAVDVYALCATLYAVMHGKPPRWPAEQDPSLVMLLELFSHPVPGLPGVPDALLDVLRSGMDNDPARRPTAAVLRDMLSDVWLGRSTAPTSGAPVSGGAAPISGAPVSGGAAPVSGAPVSGGAAPVSGAPVSGGAAPVSGAGLLDPDVTPRVPPRPPAQWPAGLSGTPARRPTWQVVLGVVGAVLLLVTVGAVSWWVGRHPGDESRSAPVSSAPAAPSGATSPAVAGPDTTPSGVGPGATASGAAGALPGCPAGLPAGARCPTELECYGPVRIRGSAAQAERVPCSGRHTWESYAVGDLPAEVDAGNHASVVTEPTVARICAATTFTAVSGQPVVDGWRFEVLPPDRSAVATGDRAYRCLAGKGVDSLVGPTLAR
ncbi:protein kinase [Plantactinospora sp. GCM10030261]|uniref:serine/threonine-protein kinase n=1 Tax=Plantactinospora sp. GCM10030261 TaxID=3273420 RepID=UPI003614B461